MCREDHRRRARFSRNGQFACAAGIRYAFLDTYEASVKIYKSYRTDSTGDPTMPTTPEAMIAAARAAVPSLTAEQAQAKLQAGEPVMILDVREKEEYDQGHIAQATLLPRGLLEFRIGQVAPDPTTTIILH
jgi:Rhodanese-like domain